MAALWEKGLCNGATGRFLLNLARHASRGARAFNDSESANMNFSTNVQRNAIGG